LSNTIQRRNVSIMGREGTNAPLVEESGCSLEGVPRSAANRVTSRLSASKPGMTFGVESLPGRSAPAKLSSA
jgi:hypothetical protein